MSDITPEGRRKNIASLADSAVSAVYDITSWVQEHDIEQAYAAVESAEEALNDIRDWLNELSDETESAAPFTSQAPEKKT